ncbi:ATP-binding protein [Streptomyces sp. NBC_01190]|uniref:ATP-binding protein n=1 Tax=Streptomyces sp. NBC_01190 TaxID=2903767 RepID=UPI003865D27D|nr:ATP-binding protein [Streptomyces sp. NBC_01190]
MRDSFEPILMTVRTVPNAVGHPGYSVTLRREDTSADYARRLARIVLGTWGLDTLIDDAALVVTELVANAIRHTDGNLIVVRLLRPAMALIRVEVVDGSPHAPRIRETGPDDEHGRGLLLVNVLTSRWGTSTTPEGKVVWGELTSEASA